MIGAASAALLASEATAAEQEQMSQPDRLYLTAPGRCNGLTCWRGRRFASAFASLPLLLRTRLEEGEQAVDLGQCADESIAGPGCRCSFPL